MIGQMLQQNRRYLRPVLFLLAAAGFVLSSLWRGDQRPSLPQPPAAVVMPAAVQIVLYAGERHLAANIETVRVTMSGGSMREDEAVFRVRAHHMVSQLNACHEDNYWVGNAEMTWGGAHDVGSNLLRRAMHCRFWDEWPAFFYGFGQYFFNRDVGEARRALEMAARRADVTNAAAYRNLSIMLLATQFDDAKLALELVRKERDQATDAGLRELLSKRVIRIEGLVILRQARKEFELRFGRALSAPQELISTGVLSNIPADPLNLGYSFENGEFQLRSLRNEGLEKLR